MHAVFENIFTNALVVQLEVVDTACKLLTNMPLTGQDFLELKLVTHKGDDEPIVCQSILLYQSDSLLELRCQLVHNFMFFLL